MVYQLTVKSFVFCPSLTPTIVKYYCYIVATRIEEAFDIDTEFYHLYSFILLAMSAVYSTYVYNFP